MNDQTPSEANPLDQVLAARRNPPQAAAEAVMDLWNALVMNQHGSSTDFKRLLILSTRLQRKYERWLNLREGREYLYREAARDLAPQCVEYIADLLIRGRHRKGNSVFESGFEFETAAALAGYLSNPVLVDRFLADDRLGGRSGRRVDLPDEERSP